MLLNPSLSVCAAIVPPLLSRTPHAGFGKAMAPGSLSLNLCQLSAPEACELQDAVAQLVPRSVRVPLTTESLSQKFKFAPKKVTMFLF